MRLHILIRPLVGAVLTTSALALVACGDDSAGAESAADRDKAMKDAQIAFARCMREHGIDMDDPRPGQRGIQLAVPDGVSPEKAQAANEACKKYLDKIKPPELSDEQQKEARDAALAHSRCMREHGVDFPDPKFGENGEATIQIDRGSGIDPEDPKFQKAEKECQREQPGILESRPQGGSETQKASP
jgi:hypothetical protein